MKAFSALSTVSKVGALVGIWAVAIGVALGLSHAAWLSAHRFNIGWILPLIFLLHLGLARRVAHTKRHAKWIPAAFLALSFCVFWYAISAVRGFERSPSPEFLLGYARCSSALVILVLAWTVALPVEEGLTSDPKHRILWKFFFAISALGISLLVVHKGSALLEVFGPSVDTNQFYALQSWSEHSTFLASVFLITRILLPVAVSTLFGNSPAALDSQGRRNAGGTV